MKTVIQEVDGMTILELSGYIDFEATRPLARSIEAIYNQNNNVRLIIKLNNLNFVGSSGISSFVKTLGAFNHLHMKPSYCGLKSEFKTLFKLFEGKDAFEIFDTEDEAKHSAHARFQTWQEHTPRSSSTH